MVKLYLAPMEGVGALPFRKAMATIGGFDEACTEFIRVSQNPQIKTLAKSYCPHQLAPYPQAAQIMGSNPAHMAEMTQALAEKGAPRIELNCGCPSNTVTGRGAGSTLLKTPELLHTIAKAMVEATTVPVSIKLRSGFEDTSLFNENMLAAQESGAAFITLHPRTKIEGYGPPADWSLIARAKSLLQIPVVGNGDIRSPQDARNMLKQTNCDALMIGRGAVTNPWIFWDIKGLPRRGSLSDFLTAFKNALSPELKPRHRLNQYKQLFGYLLRDHPEERQQMLRTNDLSPADFLSHCTSLYNLKCL
ncbi:MAG: tRNA-dihydrouridine synthase family protein [Simkaniaceae bacterium]|nr:tRNA-dihydrouridine synthase family protein [Simkaniaceae bacterium]